MKEAIKKFAKKKSLAAAGLCIAALVLIFVPLGGGDDGDEQRGVELESYTEMLEERICRLCEAVEGVSSPAVLVTLESGTEHIYADNTAGETESDGGVSFTSDYLILDRGDGSEPVLVREVCPTVRGVAVVTAGGDSPVMREKLTKLLSAALGIPTSRIMVSG